MLSGYEEAHGGRMGTKKGRIGTVYRMVVGRALGDRYAPSFEGMHVETAEGRMVLTGELKDLSQLYGVLERVYDLRLKLLSVQVLSREVR
jgi:hypothetical protein